LLARTPRFVRTFLCTFKAGPAGGRRTRTASAPALLPFRLQGPPGPLLVNPCVQNIPDQNSRSESPSSAAPVNELAEAADQRQLSRVVGRYGRLGLLLLDELGYIQLDLRGAELLFQIITEREERASIAIGTNLPFSE
jgi:hypothetical protein